mgnify:CR=1 FL=1
MAGESKQIYQLTSGTFNGSSLVPFEVPNTDPSSSAERPYITRKTTGDEVSEFVAKTQEFETDLQTTDKHIIGAINEVNTNKADNLMKGSLPNGTDLNDVKDIGVYWMPNIGITNAPASAYGVLEVFKATSTSNMIQRFTQYGANNSVTQYDTYIREFANGQWYQWKQTIHAIKKTVSPTANSYVSPFTHYAEIDARTDIGNREVIGVLLSTSSTTNPLSYNYNGGYVRVYAMKTDSVTVSIICR